MPDQLHPVCARLCSIALDCDEADVESMDELGQLANALKAQEIILLRGRPKATTSDLVEEIRKSWGSETPFTALQILKFALASAVRRDLVRAIRDVCGTVGDDELNSQRLGMWLSDLHDRSREQSPGLSLVLVKQSRSGNVWCVRDLRDLVP